MPLVAACGATGLLDRPAATCLPGWTEAVILALTPAANKERFGACPA